MLLRNGARATPKCRGGMHGRAFSGQSVAAVYRQCLRRAGRCEDADQRDVMARYLRKSFRDRTHAADREFITTKLAFAAEQSTYRMRWRKFVRVTTEVRPLLARSARARLTHAFSRPPRPPCASAPASLCASLRSCSAPARCPSRPSLVRRCRFPSGCGVDNLYMCG